MKSAGTSIFCILLVLVIAGYGGGDGNVPQIDPCQETSRRIGAGRSEFLDSCVVMSRKTNEITKMLRVFYTRIILKIMRLCYNLE